MSVPSPIEVRRDEDDELLGLLLPAGAGRWVPATIFGAALATAADEELAESVVREHGLSSLADRWWCTGTANGRRPGSSRSSPTGSGCAGTTGCSCRAVTASGSPSTR